MLRPSASMRSLLLVLSALLPVWLYGQSSNASPNAQKGAQVHEADHYDISPPLRWMLPAPEQAEQKEHPVKRIPRHTNNGNNPVTDPLATLLGTPTLAIATTLTNINGIGNGFTGPAGTFTVNAAPPDTNGDVGPNHYVAIVNTDLAVFNKSGTAIYGPVAVNTLWSGFGGGCQANNDGDPIVLYDPIADRWIISQFSVSTQPFLECVAVSQTPDPTGAYYRYSFSYTNFPDYPKLGVWPDAYYVTFNSFNAAGTSFLGAQVCAYDRSKMLAGQAATQQCFTTSNSFGGLLPADLDGARLPPAGAPNPVVGLGATSGLAYWNFHVDWATPANSTFTGPTNISTAAYAEACGGGTCIPQSGTTQQLDSLADRLMYRLAYRNFGDHEALVVNHSVTSGSSVGIRWYELRPDASRALSLFQSGTYAPDANFRWMGSMAMDQSGNMALGFSVSSTSLHPEVHYTGRLAGDAAGTMTQGEGAMIDGAGSQTGSSLSRWGDYSMMSVDPSDDCTFWYTTEYIPANGAFNWSTRIGSFKFAGCGGTVTNDFSIAASPSTVSVAQGASGTSTISTATTSGVAQSVALTVSGLPSGASASFSPTSVTSGSSSVLTLNSGTAAAGTYALTVTGTGVSATHATSVTFTITPVVANDFSIAASPSTVSVAAGGSGTSTISTATTSGSAQTVSLSATGLPAGASASFSPTSVSSGGSSTLTLNSGTAAAGTYSITITGTGASATHSTSVSFTISPVVANDFSIAASPSTVSVSSGASGTSTINTTTTSGSAQTVSLSVTGLPAGTSASFSPTSVTSGNSSTLTINTGTAAAGSYTLTVTGTGASATHSTSVGLTINPVTGGGGITNGGFEAGSLSGWTLTGSGSVVSSGAHGGTYAARVGSTSPTNGDSSIAQTFTAPSTGGTLSFYYKVVCPDTISYDWATATLKDNTAGTTATVLAKVCSNSGAWVRTTAALTANHSYTLTLISHDDNYTGDATYTYYDDVTIGVPPPPSPLVNGGFEAGSLSGWTLVGSGGVVTTSHTGTYAARLGSTSPTNGDSKLTQTFTIPTGATTLSLYYKMTCPDTVTYDWATVTLKDNTTGTTTTVLAKTCATNASWVNRTALVTAGHSYTLTLLSHDDNYAGDPTYTLYDDVIVQ